MSKRDISIIDAPVTGKAEAFDSGFRTGFEQCQIGQFYWVISKASSARDIDDDDADVELPAKRKLRKGDTYEWLGCVMEKGSNFVELHSQPSEHGGYSTTRVHVEEFEERLRFEPDADAYIQRKIGQYQAEVKHLLGQVQEVTAKLGVVPQQKIAEHSVGDGQNALAVISTQVDTDKYKNQLIVAKDETLPELFKKVETANKRLAGWMMAPSLPVKATIGPMKESIKQVEDRIYTIELYAGLTEEAVQCCDGDPAPMGEKLRVMQRRLYMDEECLANYTAGGMDITDVREFDEWISKPENRDRILPFPRTLVAMRVRREDKEREDGGKLYTAFVNVSLQQADKKTFLYVRNGDQVWRVDADFEFDEMIIPDRSTFDPSEPMMVKMFAGRVKDFMPKREWDFLVEQDKERKRLYEEWEAANPNARDWDNPHRGRAHELDFYEWEPADPTSVYFDEASEFIADEIKRYNRIAVIIQGLFDRSMVLHPHQPVQVWNPISFEGAVELIYDAMTLTHGDKPDFEAYREELNKTLGPNSIVTGQEDFWMLREAEKENERQERDWRNRDRQRSNYTRYRPYGNDGPGLVSRMDEWKARAKKAVFRWTYQRGYYGDGAERNAKLDVPASALLNVSAYKPGDYKRFFSDPRTRKEYLKWAPLMLAAEDYHAGALELGKKGKQGTDWRSY
jgi:hypothetical protein